MKLKGHARYFFIIAFILLVMFTFIIPDSTGKDYVFSPTWVTNISYSEPIDFENANVTKSGVDAFIPTDLTEDFTNADPIPFIAKDFFGYYDSDGKLLRVEPIHQGVSVSKKFWSVYTKASMNANVYTPEGKKLFEISQPGFVHLQEERIFLFLPGGNTVEEYSKLGELLWCYTMPAPITAFSSSKSGGVILGASDGCLVCLDAKGEEVFNFYPGGSDYQVILGVAVSRDGTKAACVSGIEKQRCVLIDLTTVQHKIICHEYLPKSIYRQINMFFDYSGRYVVFESATGIGIIDSKKLDTKIIPVKGQLEFQYIKPFKGLFFIITNLDGECTLTLLDENRRMVCKETFKSKTASLFQDGADIFVTLDSKIIKLSLKEGLKNEKK